MPPSSPMAMAFMVKSRRARSESRSPVKATLSGLRWSLYGPSRRKAVTSTAPPALSTVTVPCFAPVGAVCRKSRSTSAGEAALAVMWSGDAQYAIDLNSDLAYAIPKEGSNVWVDCMVIPKTAKNKENAEAFINFLCRPDIAQKNCEAIWYSTPNTEAIELMGEEYTSNTTMNPSAEDVANCEYFHDIQDFIAIYNALWQEVKNAK